MWAILTWGGQIKRQCPQTQIKKINKNKLKERNVNAREKESKRELHSLSAYSTNPSSQAVNNELHNDKKPV